MAISKRIKFLLSADSTAGLAYMKKSKDKRLEDGNKLVSWPEVANFSNYTEATYPDDVDESFDDALQIINGHFISLYMAASSHNSTVIYATNQLFLDNLEVSLKTDSIKPSEIVVFIDKTVSDNENDDLKVWADKHGIATISSYANWDSTDVPKSFLDTASDLASDTLDVIEEALDIDDDVKNIVAEGREDLTVVGAADFATFEGSDELLHIDFNKSLATLKKRPVEGDVRQSLMQLPRNTDIKHYQHTLPITVGGVTGVKLPLGVFVITGATAAGKSSFLRMFDNIHRVISVEVPDSLEELEDTPIFDTTTAALAECIVNAAEQGSLTALDSLRSTLFETQGAAGTKGVIMQFFTHLTRVSNALAQNGFTVLMTVNPMNEKADYVAEFLSNLASSVPGYITLDSVVGDTATGRIFTRDKRGGVDFTVNGNSSIESEEVVFVGSALSMQPDANSALSDVQVATLSRQSQ